MGADRVLYRETLSKVSGFRRSGLLLYFLVSTVLEGCPWSCAAPNRRDGLDPFFTAGIGNVALISPLDDAHGHAAVNHKVLSSDEVILDQRDNQPGHVLGLAFPM